MFIFLRIILGDSCSRPFGGPSPPHTKSHMNSFRGRCFVLRVFPRKENEALSDMRKVLGACGVLWG